ncbi:MAG: hypothetical protein ABSF77_09315 [Spirochaetia bacterium]|jgi:hypothetical protein
MKQAMLVVSFALVIAGCARSGKSSGEQAPLVQAAPQAPQAQVVPQQPADEGISFLPNRDRVFMRGDGTENSISWVTLGASFASLQKEILYGLVVEDTPLLDRDGMSLGSTVPAAAQVQVQEAGTWENIGAEFRMLYHVRYDSSTGPAEGWVDSSSVILIVAEAEGLAAGVLPRKIVIAGGESEYSLLAIVDGNRATLIDTSCFAFADSFHPSGVLRVSISDVNSDNALEAVVEAETIVSLRSLGTTPLRWVAWLQQREGAWTPIFQCNESFGSDAGYSYTATERAFAATGSGMLDTIRVDTDYVLTSGQDEFRSTTTSFSLWNGDVYKKAALQDLPKQGAVTVDQTPLLASSDAAAGVVETLYKGDLLFVFDRSDAPQSPDDPGSWRYKAVTKSGSEGWINGASIELTWIDPLKVNKEVFLGVRPAP